MIWEAALALVSAVAVWLAWVWCRTVIEADERARRMSARANDALGQVRGIHHPTQITTALGCVQGCACCQVAWPCSTARAIDGEDVTA